MERAKEDELAMFLWRMLERRSAMVMSISKSCEPVNAGGGWRLYPVLSSYDPLT